MENKDLNIKFNYKAIFPVITFIALILGFGSGILVMNIVHPWNTAVQDTTGQTGLQTNILDSDYFNKAFNLIKDNYIGTFPDQKALTYGALKGVVNSLGNQYNAFLDPDEAKQYLDSRNPNFEGIGITLKWDGTNTEVETTLQGYPAEKAGIKSGDVIIEVNSEKVTGVQPQVVASKVKGNAGTEVTLKILRKDKDQTKTLDFKVTRQKIVLDSVRYEDLGQGIFKINITQFLDTTPDKFNANWDKVVNDIVAKGNVKGIIVDLRNNPGGYVVSVRHVLEEFLKNGQTLMSEEQKNTNRITYTDERVGKFENVPMDVLVNEGSASASEIFSAAIQDNGRGKVIGKKTVGKGVEQTVQTLEDNSLLVIVFQKWLTPSGKNIDKANPITPDFQVDYTDADFAKGMDPQLNKAVELLK